MHNTLSACMLIPPLVISHNCVCLISSFSPVKDSDLPRLIATSIFQTSNHNTYRRAYKKDSTLFRRRGSQSAANGDKPTRSRLLRSGSASDEREGERPPVWLCFSPAVDGKWRLIPLKWGLCCCCLFSRGCNNSWNNEWVEASYVICEEENPSTDCQLTAVFITLIVEPLTNHISLRFTFMTNGWQAHMWSALLLSKNTV